MLSIVALADAALSTWESLKELLSFSMYVSSSWFLGVAWKCTLFNFLENLRTGITVPKTYGILKSQLPLSREFPSLETTYPLLFKKRDS